MFLFGKKDKESPAKKGPSLGGSSGPTPIVYRERSADNFQQDELRRLSTGGGVQSTPPRQPAYRERTVGSDPHVGQDRVPSSPQPARTASQSSRTSPSPQPSGNDEGERDRQFDTLKKQLETALREGDTDRIIEGYRNLGQHFMQGKTLAEQQAAKQMFEKALEHAGSELPLLLCVMHLHFSI